jgi:hypothetical protein
MICIACLGEREVDDTMAGVIPCLVCQPLDFELPEPLVFPVLSYEGWNDKPADAYDESVMFKQRLLYRSLFTRDERPRPTRREIEFGWAETAL